MPVSVTDVVAAQIEKVDPKLTTIFESSSEVSSMIKKAGGGDNITVSRYLYRMPLQQWRGGNFHKVNNDGGSLGIGTGMKITSVQAGYITTARSYIVTNEERDTSATSAQSVVNVFQKTLADAMTESQVDDDITFHGDGTGILTGQSSAVSSTTMTFAGASDTLGINRLREGMTVDVWDATGATKRAGAAAVPTYITNIDYTNKVVTLSQAITAIAATDILAFPDLDVYGPSTLVSFSSTWPGSPLTNGPGITGDSFRHGMYYMNDVTTSNYYLGKLKSTISQLLANRVNASSSAFTFGMVLQGLDQVTQRRDSTATSGLRGICHMKQRQAIFQIGVNISNIWLKPGESTGKMPDLMPNNIAYKDMFYLCGVPTMLSKRQYTDRIDFINPKTIKRVETHPIRFVNYGGKTVFEVRGGDGTMSTASEFHIEQGFDFAAPDPGIGLFIDSLAVPT